MIDFFSFSFPNGPGASGAALPVQGWETAGTAPAEVWTWRRLHFPVESLAQLLKSLPVDRDEQVQGAVESEVENG